ncbi:Uncharacterised protein [Legionella pneumophila]|nr:Uncharacterised protein [Legionella pneumophila]
MALRKFLIASPRSEPIVFNLEVPNKATIMARINKSDNGLIPLNPMLVPYFAVDEYKNSS